MKRLILTLLNIWITGLCLFCYGEELSFSDSDSLRFYDMKEVVVTATRMPQEIIHIPQRITVLPMFRYRMNPVLSAYDILSQVSGVTLNRSQAVFSKKSVVSLRGMGNEQGRTLILIDGVPANKASTGGVNLNRINTANIDRVEIVKGPGSSLYGGNAMGGTLNFISRRYAEPLRGTASLIWGERGTYGSNLCMGGERGIFYYTVSGQYLKSNGFNNTPFKERDASTIASSLSQYGIEGKIGMHIGRFQLLEAFASFYDGKRGDGNRYFYSEPLSGHLDMRNRQEEQNYRLTYSGNKTGKVWHLSGFYNQEKYNEQRFKGNALYDVISIRRDWGVWADFHMNSGEYNRFALGAEMKGGYVDGKDIYRMSNEKMINQGKSFLAGLWFEDELNMLDRKLKIIPALRFDLARVYDGGFFVENPSSQTGAYVPYAGPLKAEWQSAVSPKISMQYLFASDKRIYVNSGTGFRPATLEDITRMGPVNGGIITPNPTLKPEYVFTTEAGGDIRLWNCLSVTASLYYTYATDFIYVRNTGETMLMGKKERPLLQKTNAEKVNILGLEADAYLDVSDQLNFFANYTWNKAEMRTGNKGKILPYVPRNKYALGGSWMNPVVSMNLSYVQYGKQFLNDENSDFISAYGLVDLKLWHVFANKLQLSLNANNLFDRRVDENDSLYPGRMIYAEVKINF